MKKFIIAFLVCVLITVTGIIIALAEETVPALVETLPTETEAEATVSEPLPVIIIDDEPTEKTASINIEPINCYSEIFETITNEEYDLLLKILYLESDCQDIIGRRMTAEVILNRVLSPAWPNTVYEVLSQSKQFSTWKNRNKVVEGQPYKGYNDDCVDLTPEREALDYLRLNGRTYLDYDYLFFDSCGGVNGRDHIYHDGHYYGRGRWE